MQDFFHQPYYLVWSQFGGEVDFEPSPKMATLQIVLESAVFFCFRFSLADTKWLSPSYMCIIFSSDHRWNWAHLRTPGVIQVLKGNGNSKQTTSDCSRCLGQTAMQMVFLVMWTSMFQGIHFNSKLYTLWAIWPYKKSTWLKQNGMCSWKI